MKTIINQVCGGLIISSTLLGCGFNHNSDSGTPTVEEGIDIRQNPLGVIAKIMELSKDVEQIPQEIANKEPVAPVSLPELLDYLPQPPADWSADKPEGQTNSFGNYGIAQVNQTYTQDDKQVEISIFDWAFNSALTTPFLLTTEFNHESTDGYNKGLKIDGIPGREEYIYASKQGSLNLLVNGRFFVQIKGSNIEQEELRDWWQAIDYQSLNKIEQ